MARQNPIIKPKSELPEDFFRVSHLCICEKCGKEYINHQLVVFCNEHEIGLPIHQMDFPLYLHQLCNGELVKL